MKQPIILRIFKNDQLLEVKQFERDQIIFGQNADAHVYLEDSQVSPIHCLIELRDKGYYICDLGSSSGTLKNGQPVLDDQIQSGDNLEVGSFKVQFFVGVPKPKAVPEETQTKTPIVERPKVAKIKDLTPPKEDTLTPTAIPVSKRNQSPAAPPIQNVKSQSKTPIAPLKHSTKTFAPGSEIKDLRTYLRPTKGNVLEVIVSWKERVVDSYHFRPGLDTSPNKIILLGSAENSDIKVPPNFIRGNMQFIDFAGGCRVNAPIEMLPEFILGNHQIMKIEDGLRSGRATRSPMGHTLKLEQGEMICLSFSGGTLQLYIRWVPPTPIPLMSSPLDLAAGEIASIIFSMVMSMLVYFAVTTYVPPEVEKPKEDQLRLAQFIYNKPKNEPIVPTTVTTLAPIQVPERAPTTTQVVKVNMSEKDNSKAKTPSTQAVKKQEAAKAAEVMAKPTKVDRPKKFTAVKSGGAQKMGEAAGANAQAKDVSKEGLLAAFGSGGMRKTLDQAYSGSGQLLGMANEATGKSGMNENRAGDDIGSKFKDTGAGGKGTATQGIAGVGTKGKGSGMSTYGGGVGLGGKDSVNIDAGGTEEAFVGSIDREAVRRKIRSILNQLKNCYERQLRVTSGLEGKVVIQFEIEEQGRVRSAKPLTSSLNNAAVENCVAARIKETRFPEPPPGTVAVVDYPFVFGAQR